MIILASASPARSQLLTQWGIPHQVRPTHIDETPYHQSINNPKTLVETLAKVKAGQITTHQTVVAADTMIVFNHHIIGKPANRQAARHIIATLQGHTHQVWTGVCLNQHVFSEVASVSLKPMTKTQIETYLDSNDWVGAAGAYRIHQAIKPYVKSIRGDIHTVIGLPKKVIEYIQ